MAEDLMEVTSASEHCLLNWGREGGEHKQCSSVREKVILEKQGQRLHLQQRIVLLLSF